MTRQFLIVLVAVCACSLAARASSPPPARTLEERVGYSTLIVVGTAKSVVVLEEKDGKIQRVEPQPEIVDTSGQITQIEIEVDEVLYSSNWKPTPTVKYVFGGGFFELESIRKDTLGKKQIYLMKPHIYTDHKGYFLPSWDWHLAESLDEKAKIQDWIQQREANKKEDTPAPSPKHEN